MPPVTSAPNDTRADLLAIEVALAMPRKQRIVPLKVTPGTTCREAVAQSRIGDEFPDIDVLNSPLGVYGEVCAPDAQVEEGDRVEIYRPLLLEPREQRRQRLARNTKSPSP